MAIYGEMFHNNQANIVIGCVLLLPLESPLFGVKRNLKRDMVFCELFHNNYYYCYHYFSLELAILICHFYKNGKISTEIGRADITSTANPVEERFYRPFHHPPTRSQVASITSQNILWGISGVNINMYYHVRYYHPIGNKNNYQLTRYEV
jgi:hypothetical protein